VSAEAVARESADSVISAAVSTEAVSRESADSVISAAVSAEAVSRESADSVISAAVSAEAVSRESADSVISAAVSAEADARESAIISAVSTETAARASAITSAVSTETAARASAITSAVSAEAAARASADSVISAAVSAEAAARESAVSAETAARASAITSAVSAEAAARVSATSAIYDRFTQRGGDINGEANGDNSGYSVSLSADGSVVAIGAPYNDASGNSITSAGHVRVYAWNGSSWVQRGADIDSEAEYNFSGYSVSLSADGSVVAIGAHGTDVIDASGNTIMNAGRVRVYEWTNSSWVQRGGNIDGQAFYDESGYSVSLSADGSVVAIGAPTSNANGTDSGQVRVYAWNGSSWVQRGADINGEAQNDYSGYSVSISADGSIVAIGARYNDASGNTIMNAGHVRVYAWTNSSWVQRGLDIDGENPDDGIIDGYCVSLSANGNVVAIGAPGNDDSGNNAGHVRVYAWNGSSWVQRGGDIDGEAANDESGYSVSLSADGSVVAIGALGNTSYTGQVRIYKWNGLSWIKRLNNIVGEAVNDLSGTSVSLSADGNIVAIGAPNNDGNGSNSGHVRVYVYNESGIQTQIDTISATVSAALIILQDFADDTAAAAGGIPLYALYRTGNLVKIRMS